MLDRTSYKHVLKLQACAQATSMRPSYKHARILTDKVTGPRASAFKLLAYHDVGATLVIVDMHIRTDVGDIAVKGLNVVELHIVDCAGELCIIDAIVLHTIGEDSTAGAVRRNGGKDRVASTPCS